VRNKLRLACLAAVTSAVVTACTMKNVNVPSDELMRQLQAGQPMLDCRNDCLFAWDQNRRQAAALDATGRWQDLALLVMQIGYMNDLSYYYLGRAAENLGYLQAAQRYYRIAERLSVTQLSCHQAEVGVANMFGTQINVCDGYTFPDALYPHLEVVEARLGALSAPDTSTQQTRAKRVVRRQVPQPATSQSQQSTVQTPTSASASGSSRTAPPGFVEPAPAAAPTSTDFFEPPPVRR
jgi:hypothetical protein